MMEDNEESSITEFVATFGDFANAVASLVVGHRKILVEGGFDVNLGDAMAAELHAHLLGLTPSWEKPSMSIIEAIEMFGEEEDDDDDE